MVQNQKSFSYTAYYYIQLKINKLTVKCILPNMSTKSEVKDNGSMASMNKKYWLPKKPLKYTTIIASHKHD